MISRPCSCRCGETVARAPSHMGYPDGKPRLVFVNYEHRKRAFRAGLLPAPPGWAGKHIVVDGVKPCKRCGPLPVARFREHSKRYPNTLRHLCLSCEAVTQKARDRRRKGERELVRLMARIQVPLVTVDFEDVAIGRI